MPEWPDRYYASAVWTESEMIVWGGIGSDPYPYLNNGARYDPTMNASTSMIGRTTQPEVRAGHTATSTGSDMLISGGDMFANGPVIYRYDLATSTWSAAKYAFGSGGRRFRQPAVWTGSELITWGGRGSNAMDLDNGERYNPLSDQCKDVKQFGESRSDHTAVWSNERMVVWGGSHDGAARATGAIYDPIYDQWSPMSNIGTPSARATHTAIAAGDKMIVWGGRNGLNYFADGGIFDVAGNTWQPLPDAGLLSPRYAHTAIWTNKEMIVWGGRGQGFLNDSARYNPATQAWTLLPATNAPEARTHHTAVWTGTEMLIWGGLEGNTASASGARYHRDSNTWTPMTEQNAPSARWSHSAVWANDRMLVFGGNDADRSFNDLSQYRPGPPPSPQVFGDGFE